MKRVNTHTTANFSLIPGVVFFIASATSSVQAWEKISLTDYIGSSSPETGIEVPGMASAEFPPDIATLNLAVETIRDTIREASADSTQTFTKTLHALESAGISRDDIKADNIEIQPEYRHIDENPVVAGYRVWRNLTVTIRDLDSVPKVASAVITAGGNELVFYGVEFHLENPGSKRAELQAQAAADARSRAETYAEAAGVTLGRLIYIKEISSPYAPHTKRNGLAGMASAGAVRQAIADILPGDVSLSVAVQARFSIERHRTKEELPK